MKEEQYTSDLNEIIPALEIPVYIFHGVFDRQVFFDLSRAYFEGLQASKKAFYSFEESAYSQFLKKPEHFIKIVLFKFLFFCHKPRVALSNVIGAKIQ